MLPFVPRHSSLNYLFSHSEPLTSSYSREHFSPQAFYCYCLPHKMQTTMLALKHRGYISISQESSSHIHSFFFLRFLNAPINTHLLIYVSLITVNLQPAGLQQYNTALPCLINTMKDKLRQYFLPPSTQSLSLPPHIYSFTICAINIKSS